MALEGVPEGDSRDQGPLLPGEVADSNIADDADHWMAVYQELTNFLDEVDPPGEAVERYRRRLEHWRCRRGELDAAAVTDTHSAEAH